MIVRRAGFLSVLGPCVYSSAAAVEVLAKASFFGYGAHQLHVGGSNTASLILKASQPESSQACLRCAALQMPWRWRLPFVVLEAACFGRTFAGLVARYSLHGHSPVLRALSYGAATLLTTACVERWQARPAGQAACPKSAAEDEQSGLRRKNKDQ